MKYTLCLILMILGINIFAEGTVEQELVEIELAGLITDRMSELSGLTWYEDHLILMPQYPNFPAYEGSGKLYKIHRSKLMEYIVGDVTAPLTPEEITIDENYFRNKIPGYEGFEAIAFYKDRVYFTIESETDKVIGYIVQGKINEAMNEIVLDTLKLVEIAPQADIPNASEETLLIFEDKVLTIYEGNGINVNPEPVAHVFDLELNSLGTVKFPNLEYRITDATLIDTNNEFWIINYFWPGEKDVYLPAEDKIFQLYGKGKTHSKTDVVERIIKLSYTNDQIIISDFPPLQLKLMKDARNLEGIVKFDDLGFLVCTDRFPKTILGFIPCNFE